MIHYTPEATYLKIGLNFRFTTGGFTALWAWYDVGRRELTVRRFRFRAHIRPWTIRSKTVHNVVENYASMNDLLLVPRALLEDECPRVIGVAQFLMQERKRGL